MTDRIIHERYRELAARVIRQGVFDWLGKPSATDYELYSWIQNCDLFDYLGIDKEYFYVKVLRLRDERRRLGDNDGEGQNL